MIRNKIGILFYVVFGKNLMYKTITTGSPTKLLFGFKVILKTRRKWIFRCFTKTNKIKVEIGDFSMTNGSKEVVLYMIK